MSAEIAGSADSVIYRYRPSLLGAPFEFRLTGDGLEWTAGRRTGRAAYRDIRRVRLSYRPANMQAHRFMTEIWADGAPKLQIVSGSWKSMVQMERLDGPYNAFIAELHRRLASTGTATVFEQGSHRLMYWLGILAFVAVELCLAALVARALQSGARTGAIFVAAFMALFLWQGGDFLRRNKPGFYRPDALPAQVLPKG